MRTEPLHIEARHGLRASKRLLKLAGDDRLAAEIRGGNEAAFDVAFERHGRGLLSFCRHMLGSREEAEEAVQHTFAAAWSDLQRNPQREVRLKPWLYAVARNRCVSLLRARRPDTDELDEETATAGLGDEVGRRADLRALLADLRALPEEQRAALVLTELGGLSHAEVAEVLGRKEGDVKGIVFRARSTLIDWRAARETSCQEIREQLSVLEGGSLRRRTLRRHLQTCSGCRDYREQVKAQRRMMAAILPVAPTVAFKSGVFAAAAVGGGSAAGGGAAGVGALGAGALGAGALGPLGATVAKVAVVGAIAGGAATAGIQAVDSDDPAPRTPPASASPTPASGYPTADPAAAGSTRGSAPASSEAAARGRGRHADTGSRRGAAGRERGKRRGGGRGASSLAPPQTPLRARGNPPALGRAKRGLGPPPAAGTRDGGRVLGRRKPTAVRKPASGGRTRTVKQRPATPGGAREPKAAAEPRRPAEDLAP